jgi:two-component system, OmpR family, alkaline phosphatase synthesis response regulator PhoP
MPKARILIVEDDADIAELIQYHLQKEGYSHSHTDQGEKVLPLTKTFKPTLILLDLMLPGIDGYEVCRLLKSDPATRAIPILMLTAKSEETDIVTGLELGAEDYLPKPFSPKVLLARIRTILRRLATPPVTADSKRVEFQNIKIDPGRHEVWVSGKTIALTVTEFRILQLLLNRPGWVFNRNQIVEGVRGEGYAVTDRSVDVQIVGLRRKLGRAGKQIETIRGVGYRLKE